MEEHQWLFQDVLQEREGNRTTPFSIFCPPEKIMCRKKGVKEKKQKIEKGEKKRSKPYVFFFSTFPPSLIILAVF